MKIYKISKSQRATRIFRIAAPKNYQMLMQPQNNTPDVLPDSNVSETNQYQAQDALKDSVSAAQEAKALQDQAAKVEKETGQTGLKDAVKNNSDKAIQNTPAYKMLSPGQLGYVATVDTLQDPNNNARIQKRILDNIKELQQQKVNKTKQMPS